MIRWNHDIYHELPEFKDKINQLINKDPHFSHLVDQFHEINKTLDRVHRHIYGTDSMNMTQLKKERLHLKDEVYNQLQLN
jgi:hypothetical protein